MSSQSKSGKKPPRSLPQEKYFDELEWDAEEEDFIEKYSLGKFYEKFADDNKKWEKIKIISKRKRRSQGKGEQ